VRRYRFLFNNQPDALFIQIYSVMNLATSDSSQSSIRTLRFVNNYVMLGKRNIIFQQL